MEELEMRGEYGGRGSMFGVDEWVETAGRSIV